MSSEDISTIIVVACVISMPTACYGIFIILRDVYKIFNGTYNYGNNCNPKEEDDG